MCLQEDADRPCLLPVTALSSPHWCLPLYFLLSQHCTVSHTLGLQNFRSETKEFHAATKGTNTTLGLLHIPASVSTSVTVAPHLSQAKTTWFFWEFITMNNIWFYTPASLTLLHNKFRLLPINGHDMNKINRRNQSLFNEGQNGKILISKMCWLRQPSSSPDFTQQLWLLPTSSIPCQHRDWSYRPGFQYHHLLLLAGTSGCWFPHFLAYEHAWMVSHWGQGQQCRHMRPYCIMTIP